MKNLRIRIIALLLALALLLTGCSGAHDFWRLMNTYITGSVPVVRFENMDYTRPDLAAFQDYHAQCVELSQAEGNSEALEENIWLLYDAYYDFCTMYSLADIYYSRDMTDLYWQEEYAWCM